jgi:hypothetical protein
MGGTISTSYIRTTWDGVCGSFSRSAKETIECGGGSAAV